mmetsp:Transcript_33949/g.28682  ORF Transcript_33949/g.28682 Transcript_33949/m.28682 type:complete len:270 (+) Transcript_33949:81-890(+)
MRLSVIAAFLTVITSAAAFRGGLVEPRLRVSSAAVARPRAIAVQMAQMTASGDDAARFERRSALAAVLTSLIALPAAARANELSDLFAKSPNDVVTFLLDALAKNDSPQPNAGLTTFLSAASPSNPVTKEEPAKFIEFIKSSGYSILLGKYDARRMAPAQEGTLANGSPGATVSIRLDSTLRKFAAMGVDSKFLFAADEAGSTLSDSATSGDQDSKLFVIMEFQLSKDPVSKGWRTESVYFVPIEKMYRENPSPSPQAAPYTLPQGRSG